MENALILVSLSLATEMLRLIKRKPLRKKIKNKKWQNGCSQYYNYLLTYVRSLKETTTIWI